MRRLARQWMFALALAIGAIGATSTFAHAEPHRPLAGGGANKEDVKKRIRTMRAYQLTEELQLDDTTTAKVFPILAKYDDLTDKLLAQRGDLQKKLSNPPKNPKAIDQIVDDSIANQRALWDSQEKRLAELRTVLTPLQTAGLLVVLPVIEKRLQQQLQNAAAGGGGGGGGGRRGKGGGGKGAIPDDGDGVGPGGRPKNGPGAIDDPY